MSSAPFDTDVVINRLRSVVSALRRVHGSAEYAAINGLPGLSPPEAFVVLLKERGGPLAGGTNQAAGAIFGVVTAARHYGEGKGTKAMEAARPLIGAVRDAIVGWVPTDSAGIQVRGGRGCRWVQGEVLDYDNSTLLWSDVFQTQHFIGSQQ